MLNFKTSRLHWNFFISIEDDLKKISRYIEFSERNFGTYSIELARILFSASSEVDTVMKQICKLHEPDRKFKSINEYRALIKQNVPDLIDEEIIIDRYGIKVKPWLSWLDAKNPAWWSSYTEIKHNRNEFFEKANLVNAINAVGALLIVQVYYYKLAFSKEANSEIKFKEATRHLLPKSSFMRMRDEYYFNNLIV
jgi:hypothetical protein